MRDQLPDDPFHACFELPEVVQALIDKGALGQKTGAGFYRKQGKAILRLDPAKGDFVPADAQYDAGESPIQHGRTSGRARWGQSWKAPVASHALKKKTNL